jgi:hypothetical protein
MATPDRPGPPVAGLIGYGLCLALGVLAFSPYLPEVLPRWTQAAERWQPAPEATQWPLPMVWFVVVGPFLTFPLRLIRSRSHLRAHGPWLLARLAIVLALLGSCSASLGVIGGAQALLDHRFEKAVGQLQTGMTRPAVYRQLLDVNAANGAAPSLPAAANGKGGDWPETRIAAALFKREDTEKANDPIQRFTRSYFFALDDLAYYRLTLTFGPDQRLQTLRYVREHMQDSHTDCTLLRELPPVSGRPYPCPCDSATHPDP